LLELGEEMQKMVLFQKNELFLDKKNKVKNLDMAGSGMKTVVGIVTDLVCVIIVFSPNPILNQYGEPYKRGFFCNDESIRHPYKDSTISTAVLILVSFLVPILAFILVEIAVFHAGDSRSWRNSARSFYVILVVFVFGAAATQLITDICKYSIGRLRPHFIDACNPSITFDLATCRTEETPAYIENFTCQGSHSIDEAERQSRIKDARLSFLSGHASLSFYAMLFASIYIQRRLTNRNYRLVKPLIQLACMLFAVYTTLSRRITETS